MAPTSTYNPDIQYFGIVVVSISQERNQSLSCIVYSPSQHDIFLMPRYIFSKEHIQHMANECGGMGKSRMNKLQDELYDGQEIYFHTNGNIITKFERCIKGQERFQFIETGCAYSIQFNVYGVISDEPVRRFHCQENFPDLKIPSQLLYNYLPNVLYDCAIIFTVDLGKFEPDQPIEQCHPTFKFVLDRFLSVSRRYSTDFEDAQRIVTDTPWNIRRQFDDTFDPRYPKMVVPFAGKNREFMSECVILDYDEAFCVRRPVNKCLIGFIIKSDYLFVQGRTLFCYLYYCRYNKAYIIYKYRPQLDPKPKPGITEHKSLLCPTKSGVVIMNRTRLHSSKENPMETRFNREDEILEFLAYVKLNRIGHFFCSYSIPCIADPKNILHGRIQLGDQNQEHRHEKEQMIGHRVWLRFMANKRILKWEIASLDEEEEDIKIEHKAFTSVGMKLNKRQGLVHCPSVCNFPLQLDEHLGKSDVLEIGDWFRFEAIFDESKQCYVIFRIIELIKNYKYDVTMLEGQEDVYAFKIPLYQNYHHTRNLLINYELGFVEDIDTKVTLFICAWEEQFATENKTQVPVEVWCRYNPDVANRKAPLCVIDIKEPNGVRCY